VEPDIILPNLFEHIKSGERYLDYSLPWDSIAGIDFTPWPGKSYDIGQLRERSLARAAKDEGLRIIKEEALKAKKRSEDTKVSLCFDDIRQKREEAEQTREKVGAHFRKYREEQESEFDSDGKKEKDEDPKITWLKDVNQDPYINEAVNIVGDIIHFSK
jgi:carboxyl-terminal processing protease